MTYSEQIEQIKQALQEADAVVVGAGSGLSTSAGLTYSGPRFQEHFGDFIQKYKIQDMYSGGFYPFDTLEEHWAWWGRHILINKIKPFILTNTIRFQAAFFFTGKNPDTAGQIPVDLHKSNCNQTVKPGISNLLNRILITF